jgi:hypothetical protein
LPVILNFKKCLKKLILAIPKSRACRWSCNQQKIYPPSFSLQRSAVWRPLLSDSSKLIYNLGYGIRREKLPVQ